MSLYESTQQALRTLGRVGHVSDDTLKLIGSPMREVRVSVPVKMDDGSLQVFEGFRVQHNNWRGPFKGGIRFHEEVDLDEVKTLALLMSLKTAVVGIPMGGGKGGVTVNPKELSAAELEQLSRGWIRAMGGVVGPMVDVPAPDVNTSSREMDWMADEFGDKAVVTGKSLTAGGSLGRDSATAMGGWHVLKALQERLGLPESPRVVVQGFGNAGRTFARIAHEAGWKVIAVSDSKGAILQEDGLDVPAVETQKDETRTVVGFAGSTPVSGEDVLEIDCDVLVLAALGGAVHAKNVGALETQVILELANGPVTGEADAVLAANGTVVIPDILANAGGVTVSYFEWEQNRAGDSWSKEEVARRLEETMNASAEAVWKLAEDGHMLREAAFLVALKRLEEAYVA